MKTRKPTKQMKLMPDFSEIIVRSDPYAFALLMAIFSSIHQRHLILEALHPGDAEGKRDRKMNGYDMI